MLKLYNLGLFTHACEVYNERTNTLVIRHLECFKKPRSHSRVNFLSSRSICMYRLLTKITKSVQKISLNIWTVSFILAILWNREESTIFTSFHILEESCGKFRLYTFYEQAINDLEIKFCNILLKTVGSYLQAKIIWFVAWILVEFWDWNGSAFAQHYNGNFHDKLNFEPGKK